MSVGLLAMLILNIIRGPDKGKRFELPDNEPQIIGRSSESLALSDMTISRRHAELTPDNGQWYINDHKSANGTFVNGEFVNEPILLTDGDQIRVGRTLIAFGRISQTQQVVQPVKVLPPEQMDISIENIIPFNDDSVIMAVPEPSAAAVEQLSVLYELMQLVGTTFDRKALLEHVMDLVFAHFQTERGFILIQDSPDERPDPIVVRYRRKPLNDDQHKIMVSRTIVQHVLKNSEGVLSSNAMKDERFSSGDSVQAYGIRSAICVPIKFHDRCFGVIHIDSQVANFTYTEDQLRLLTAIGAQTGLALYNAELYQQGLKSVRLAAVGETVASLTHSIRNMLQGMRGGAEVVELGIRKDDMSIISNGWGILSRNLDRIYELMVNMLAYSKRRKPELEMVQITSLLKEIVEWMQPQCEKRDVALITDFDDNMPPVSVDPGGVHQVVTNLLYNALDAVESSSGVVTLRCEYHPDDSVVKIIVSDNGVGIEPENLRDIFTPFYSTKGQRGTGLGLAVTKKIVDEHRGKIDVISGPADGSTFVVTLSVESKGDSSETNT